jgi:hypothetical protein
MLTLMAMQDDHEPMFIPTQIAVQITRRLVDQGGPRPRFVRPRRP